MPLTRKQVCVDCHFLVKEARTLPADRVPVLEISREHRDLARKGDYTWLQDHYSLCCHFGVWDEGHNFDIRQRHQVIAEQDRRNFCFFWRHRPGMFLPAAKILQQREAELRESSRDRKLTIVGLWIAALALLADVWLRLADRFHWWPAR